MIRLLFILLSFVSFSVEAKNVKIAVGLSLPPYFIETQNTGMEYEVIKEALKEAGHTMVVSFVPFARVPVMLNDGEADAAATMSESSNVKAFYSDSHITYQNFAISLAKSKLVIN